MFVSTASLHMEEEIFIELYQTVAIYVYLGGSVIWNVYLSKIKYSYRNSVI